MKDKLINLSTSITDGEHGSLKNKYVNVNGYYVFSMENIYDNNINIKENQPMVDYDTFNKIQKKSKVATNSVLLTAVGDLGRTALVRTNKIDFCFISGVVIINSDASKLLPKFLYYYLQSPISQYRLKNCGSTNSNQKHFVLQDAEEFEIEYPDLDKQKNIIDLIDPIELKIHNNNSIIKSLNNKIKDTYSYYMPKQNGEKRKLLDFVSIVNDTYSGNGNLPLIDLSIIPSNSLIINELCNSNKLNTNLKTLRKGDFLFGSIRPYLKKSIISPIDGLTTGTVIQMRPYRANVNNFLLGILTSESFFEFAINNSTGTKMPVVKAKDLVNYEFTYNESFIEWFEKQNNYFDLIISLLNENIKLNEYKKLLLSTLFK